MKQIVINIPESIYEEVMSDDWSNLAVYGFCKAIQNGVPLPKGHGRIVDTKNFKSYLNDSYIDSVGFTRAMSAINHLKTIIEADTESEDKE